MPSRERSFAYLQESVQVRDLSHYMEASPSDCVVATSVPGAPAQPTATSAAEAPLPRTSVDAASEPTPPAPKLPRHESPPPQQTAAVIRSNLRELDATAEAAAGAAGAEGPGREPGSMDGEAEPRGCEVRRCGWEDFAVPPAVIEKSARCIDVVTGELHDANCFTKSYSKYAKGTGSVVATRNLHLLASFEDWAHRELVRGLSRRIHYDRVQSAHHLLQGSHLPRHCCVLSCLMWFTVCLCGLLSVQL